jgi:non-homologous end joining protein Ku
LTGGHKTAQFPSAEGEGEVEMVASAKAIIAQRTGPFDPSAYKDRYLEALRKLVEAKMKMCPIYLRRGSFIRAVAPSANDREMSGG